MELSNFEMVESDAARLFARVDVTTSAFLWRKYTERRLVAYDGMYWSFVDTGAYTPGAQCEQLHRSYRLRQEAERAGVEL
jgi:hypothetical protein